MSGTRVLRRQVGQKADEAAAGGGTLKKVCTGILGEILLCLMRNMPDFPKEKSVNSPLFEIAYRFGPVSLFWRRGTQGEDQVLGLA